MQDSQGRAGWMIRRNPQDQPGLCRESLAQKGRERKRRRTRRRKIRSKRSRRKRRKKRRRRKKKRKKRRRETSKTWVLCQNRARAQCDFPRLERLRRRTMKAT